MSVPVASHDAKPTKIRLATVETRRPEGDFPVPGARGWSFTNLGAGKKWTGMVTKVDLYLAFARKWARRDPSQLLILADGGDVGFGGCDLDELWYSYHAVTGSSGGARVVAGGDNSIWPHVLRRHAERYKPLVADRLAILDAFGLREDSFHPYQEFGLYAYVNSGFIMGPARELESILGCMRDAGWGVAPGKFDDQYALTECMFRHPRKITVDYTGSIVLDMMGFKHDILHAHRGAIYNRVTGRRQCFVHGNGKSYPPSALKEMLTNYSLQASV